MLTEKQKSDIRDRYLPDFAEKIILKDIEAELQRPVVLGVDWAGNACPDFTLAHMSSRQYGKSPGVEAFNQLMKEETKMEIRQKDIRIETVENGFIVRADAPNYERSSPMAVFETVQGLNAYIKKLYTVQPAKKAKKKSK